LVESPLFCVVGFGRVGEVTAAELSSMGVDVSVYDASISRVRAARELGFDSHLVDVIGAASRIAHDCDVAATALPSGVAEEAIPALINAGSRIIVDVSYIRDPLALHDTARERGAMVVVDAGLAPGLSNIIAGSVAGLLSLKRLMIYVGGVSSSEDVLGIVASWNMEDLVEEYTRPARARVGGRSVLLDPLLDARSVEVPGVGVFDALPTDGLRTLLYTMSDVDTMVEYTLRYKGHVDLLRALRRLGLLSSRSYVVEGCTITPRKLLARLLEEKLPRSDDRVILYVSGEGEVEEGYNGRVEYLLDVRQRELALDKPVLTFLTGFVHAHVAYESYLGEHRPGVVPPERLSAILPRILRALERRGVVFRVEGA